MHPQSVLAQSVVLFAVISCLVRNYAFCQDTVVVDLDRISVTANRTEGSVAGAVDNVVVISQDEITRMPARNLGEALSYVPGVDVLPRKGFGQSSSLTMQGADSRQVRVMVDGIPFNSQSSCQVNPSMLPIDNIKRIEIVKGASSNLWGSGLGGVINIITRATGTTGVPSASVTSSMAEFRTRQDSARVSGKTAGLGYFISSEYMESGGRGERNDVLEKKSFGKLSYDLCDLGTIDASFGYSGARVNSGVLPDGSWQAQPYRCRYGRIGWKNDSCPARIAIDFKHSRNDIVTVSYLSVSDAEPFFRGTTNDRLYQASVSMAVNPVEKDILVVGSDFDWDMLKSDVYLPAGRRLGLQAPFANYTLTFDSFDLIAGVRYDRNSEFGHQVSPGGGIVCRVPGDSATVLKFKISRAFSAPPLLWKYNANDLLGVAPNFDIRAERAMMYETVCETRPWQNVWITGSLYRSDVTNALSLQENESGMFYMKNFDKFRRQGGELSCKIKLSDSLTVSGSGEFNDIEDRATRATVKGGGKPRHRFLTGLSYGNMKGFALDVKGYYYFWNEPASSEANDRKMLFDLKASQRFKYATVFVTVYNLTNSQYWQDYYFPVPLRYFEAGCTVSW